MWKTCPYCGGYEAAPAFLADSRELRCAACGKKRPFVPQPLLVITGASGVGKSSLSARLFYRQTQQTQQTAYVVMESDILWSPAFDTPEDGYRAFRGTWLRLAADIGQGGKPVVLCGCATPGQFADCIEYHYFSHLYYLALCCDEETLEKRLREGRGVTEDKWIESSLAFNRWIREKADTVGMTRLDTTGLSIEEAAQQADQWIRTCLRIEKENV